MSGSLILPGGAEAPEQKKSLTADLSEEDKAALDRLAEEHPEDTKEDVAFAFLVIKTLDGDYVVTHDLDAAIAPRSTADDSEVVGAFEAIKMNSLAAMTAAMTAQTMVQQAMVMQKAQQDAALRARLGI